MGSVGKDVSAGTLKETDPTLPLTGVGSGLSHWKLQCRGGEFCISVGVLYTGTYVIVWELEPDQKL